MIIGKPSPFLDISDIDHKQVNVSFSVQNILNTDDYLLQTPKQQKCKLGKTAAKCGKNSQKKDIQNQIRNAYHQGNKNKKKLMLGKGKNKEAFDEKDTVDDSETAKLSTQCKSPKLHQSNKSSKKQISHKKSQQKINSNKIQPMKKSRQQARSISSLASPRKNSQIPTNSCQGTPINSCLTLDKPLPSGLLKVRSQTIRYTNQEVKAKNENIVIQDYFYENENKNQEVKKNTKEVRKRSTSSVKKIDFQSKKLKKAIQIQECFSPRSPRVTRK